MDMFRLLEIQKELEQSGLCVASIDCLIQMAGLHGIHAYYDSELKAVVFKETAETT